MKTKILRVTATVAVVALIPTSALQAQSGQGPAQGPQKSSATCLEAVVQLEGDADRVKEHVPEPFKSLVRVNPVTGKANVNLLFEPCSIFLDGEDGETPIPLHFNTINIPIDRPENGDDGCSTSISPPIHNYTPLMATDSREHYRWLKRLGVGTLIKDSTFEFAEGPPATVFADLPGWYTVTMVGADPPTVDEGISVDVALWQLGRFGAVRHCFHPENIRVLPSVALVRAYPGSPLAGMIGTEPVTAAGIIGRFEFTAESEVVD